LITWFCLIEQILSSGVFIIDWIPLGFAGRILTVNYIRWYHKLRKLFRQVVHIGMWYKSVVQLSSKWRGTPFRWLLHTFHFQVEYLDWWTEMGFVEQTNIVQPRQSAQHPRTLEQTTEDSKLQDQVHHLGSLWPSNSTTWTKSGIVGPKVASRICAGRKSPPTQQVPRPCWMPKMHGIQDDTTHITVQSTQRTTPMGFLHYPTGVMANKSNYYLTRYTDSYPVSRLQSWRQQTNTLPNLTTNWPGIGDLLAEQ